MSAWNAAQVIKSVTVVGVTTSRCVPAPTVSRSGRDVGRTSLALAATYHGVNFTRCSGAKHRAQVHDEWITTAARYQLRDQKITASSRFQQTGALAAPSARNHPRLLHHHKAALLSINHYPPLTRIITDPLPNLRIHPHHSDATSLAARGTKT